MSKNHATNTHLHVLERRIRCSMTLLLALLPAVFLFSLEAAVVEGGVRVMKKEGATVEVLLNGAPIEVQIGSILKQGTKIRTGKDGMLNLMFDNGAVLEIKPNTDFLIEKFEREPFEASKVNYKTMASEPSPSITKLKVDAGAVLVGVKKLQSQSQFHVATPVGSAGIRGTSFFVKYDKQKRSEGMLVGVTEGKVEIATPQGAIQPVRAGQAYGITSNSGGSTITPNPPAAREFMSQTRGIDRQIRKGATDKLFEPAPSSPRSARSKKENEKWPPASAGRSLRKKTVKRVTQGGTDISKHSQAKKTEPDSETAFRAPMSRSEESSTDSGTAKSTSSESSQDFFKGAGDAPKGDDVVGSFFDSGFRPALPPNQSSK